MSEPAAREHIEDRVGRYRLLAVLGRGGMGDVYLAIADGIEGFSKLLVVKELRREQDDDLHLALFMDEARLAARLNHPNIVQTLEVGTDGPRWFMVMEYLEGQSLRNVVLRSRRGEGTFPRELYLGVVVNVLDALAYVHGLTELDGRPLGIVHRDVSPQNVIVTYDGHVKLIDFGIAKTHVASQQTTMGIVKGKVRYMAPEQATGRPVDRRTDIFSVGVILWDALVGRSPWAGMSDLQVLQSLMNGSVPRLRDQVEAATLPREIVALVDQATDPDPLLRFSGASALREELLRHVEATLVRDLPRSLGKMVSQAFADERREFRGVVDARLRGAAADASNSLVSLTRMRTPYSDARSQPSVGRAIGAEEAADGMPSREVIAQFLSVGPARARAPRGRAVAIAVAGAVILGAAVATGVALRMNRGSAAMTLAPATPAPPAVAPSPGAPTEALPATAHVVVRVSPGGARLTVDDVAVTNPYEADLPRSDATHVLVADGPGLVRRTRAFRSSADTEIEIALDRAPIPHFSQGREHAATSPAVVAEPPARVGSSPPAADAPPARPHRTREMDKENPYAP